MKRRSLARLKKTKKNCTDGGGGKKWAEKWVKVEVNRWSDKFKSFFAPAENWKDCCGWWAERKMKQPSTWNKDSKERKRREEKSELSRWAKARGREERVSVKPHGGQDTSTRLISISFKWYHSWGSRGWGGFWLSMKMPSKGKRAAVCYCGHSLKCTGCNIKYRK